MGIFTSYNCLCGCVQISTTFNARDDVELQFCAEHDAKKVGTQLEYDIAPTLARYFKYGRVCPAELVVTVTVKTPVTVLRKHSMSQFIWQIECEVEEDIYNNLDEQKALIVSEMGMVSQMGNQLSLKLTTTEDGKRRVCLIARFYWRNLRLKGCFKPQCDCF